MITCSSYILLLACAMNKTPIQQTIFPGAPYTEKSFLNLVKSNQIRSAITTDLSGNGTLFGDQSI